MHSFHSEPSCRPWGSPQDPASRHKNKATKKGIAATALPLNSQHESWKKEHAWWSRRGNGSPETNLHSSSNYCKKWKQQPQRKTEPRRRTKPELLLHNYLLRLSKLQISFRKTEKTNLLLHLKKKLVPEIKSKTRGGSENSAATKLVRVCFSLSCQVELQRRRNGKKPIPDKKNCLRPNRFEEITKDRFFCPVRC